MPISNDIILWFDVFVLLSSIFLVWKYGKSREQKLTYSLFVFGLLFWLVTLLLYYTDLETKDLLFVGRANFVSIKLATLGYYLFIRVFLKNGDRVNWKDFMWLFINVIVISLTFFSPFIVSKEIALEDNNRETEFGQLFPIYIITMTLDILFAFFYAIKNYSKSGIKEQKQIKVFVIFSMIAMAFGAVTNLVLPQLGYFNFQMYGTLSLTFLNLAIVFLVVKLQFLNVKIIFGRVIYYLILIILTVSSYYFVIFIDRQIFSNSQEGLVIHTSIAIVLALIFVLAFNKINDILKKQVRTRFINPGYDPYEVLEEFNKKISRLVNEEDLALELRSVMERTLRPKKIEIVFDSEQNDFHKEIQSYWNKSKTNRIILTSDEFVEISNNKSNPLFIGDKILKMMEENEIFGVFYLYDQDRYFGALLLGFRDSEVEYSMYDIEFVENITKMVGFAALRSVLYQELEQFNQTLQNKVNDQTKELQVKVQQLQEARRKERDMIDIMGHELRTPATIVKLNAELLQGFTDEILSNKEKFAKYVKRIKDAVENEIKLINTLLSSAKLEGDKIELNLEEVDILSEIEMSLHGHESIAQEKGLNVINQVDPRTPSIYADHARVIEVLNNLIDNAIKYTEKGNVTIQSSFDEKMVNISIIDSGQGIKEEDISNLGKKFFRVGTYLDTGEGKPDIVRPGGTGLGLYVTFGLVEKMGGKITVESKIGIGSKFTFSLPRYIGQANNKKETTTKNMFERLGLQR